MPRNKKITSDNRDALEILRAAFVDVKTPRVAELETRKKRTRIIASDPYREPIAEDVPAKISKKLAVERQTRKQQPTITESQDVPPPFWEEPNEGGATPQERLETIEEQIKTIPPEDRKEFEELTAKIKAQFELQDQKGTEAPQQLKQSVPPLQPPKQFAEKPQSNEMNKHVIPEDLARSAIAMGLKNKETPNRTPKEDELGNWENEGGAVPSEKSPNLANVKAQLEENLAKVHDETKVLTQEEVDAILASAPKEEPSKTTEDEDKKTEADHKARMRSPQPLSPEDLPKEPAPPQNSPPETEQKKSEETKAAEAWTEWTAKETEKEKDLSKSEQQESPALTRESSIKAFEEKIAALEAKINETGGTRDEKTEHRARKIAQEQYAYDLAKMTGQLTWLRKPENKTGNLLKIQNLEAACQLVAAEIGETPPVEPPLSANENMGMLGPLGSAEFKKSITDGLEATEKDYKAGKITSEVYANLKAKYTGILEIIAGAAQAAPTGEKKMESPEVKKNIDDLLQGRFLDNEQIRELAGRVLDTRTAMGAAYPRILADRKRPWIGKAWRTRAGGEAPEEVAYETAVKALLSNMEQTHRSNLTGRNLNEKQVHREVSFIKNLYLLEQQRAQEVRARAAPEAWTGTFTKWGQRYTQAFEQPFRWMNLSEDKVQKYGKNLRIFGTVGLMTGGVGAAYLGLSGTMLAVYGGKRLTSASVSSIVMGPLYGMIAKGSDRLTRRGVEKIGRNVEKTFLKGKETRDRADAFTEYIFQHKDQIDKKIAKTFVREKRWKWAGLIGAGACIGLASSAAFAETADIAGAHSGTADQINLERRALDQAFHQKAFANADELYKLKHGAAGAGTLHSGEGSNPVPSEATPHEGPPSVEPPPSPFTAEILTDAQRKAALDAWNSKPTAAFPDHENPLTPEQMDNLKKFYEASAHSKAAIIEQDSNMYKTTREFVASGAMTEDQWHYAWTHSELFDRVHAGDRILIEDTPGGNVFHVIPDSKLPLGANAAEALTSEGKKLTPIIERAVDKNLGKPSVSDTLKHAAEKITTRPTADLADEISKTELAGGKTLAEAFQTQATTDTFAKLTLPQQEAYLHSVEGGLTKLRHAIEASDPSVQSSYEPLATNAEKLLADLRANTSYTENMKAWHQLESRFMGSEAGLTRGQFETIANNWTVGKFMKFDEHSLVGNDPTHGSLEYAMQTNGRAIHEHLTTYIEGKIGKVAEQLRQDVRPMKLGEFLKLSIAK